MADILSQSEIDNLLKALDSGNTENIAIETEKKEQIAKRYDFARPSKFNKEQLRTLELIFDNYSRMVSSFLTAYLRTPAHVEILNAEQMLYNEFNNSLVNPVILGLLSLRPFKGTTIMELSSNIGFAILDRLLGGPGISLKKVREFSEIEKILLERVISQLVAHLVEPWKGITTLKPTIEQIETNSQFAQIISPSEITALVTLSIKIGASEGFINFCLPHMVIEPIVEKLNTKHWFTKHEDEGTFKFQGELEAKLQDTKVPITTIIGKTNITVNEFINLQVGDIITLDSYVDSDLGINIGNSLKFYGKPGINRGKNSIQITELIKKGE